MGRLAGVVAACLLLSPVAAQGAEEGEKLRLVCSTTQVADFVRQVVGDRCHVDCILSPGADPHLYETKPGDAQLVGKANLCFDNGLHLEGKDWMRTLAETAGKPIVTCTEGVEPLKLSDGKEEYHDPHAWFSITNAATYVNNIQRAMIDLDPAGAEQYKSRARLYLDQLRALHLWTQREVTKVPPAKRILVTSHDAFQYFCAEHGFKSAAPVGWSTGEEVGAGLTPAKRKATVDSIRSFGVKAIFVETSVNPKLIREIASEAGVSIGGELYSDSMGPPDSAGETYIGMMRENVLTIVGALKE
jgi:manganese/iron transport system substrate-binding protein